MLCTITLHGIRNLRGLATMVLQKPYQKTKGYGILILVNITKMVITSQKQYYKNDKEGNSIMKLIGWRRKKKSQNSEKRDDILTSKIEEFLEKRPFSDETLFGDYSSTRYFQYSKKLIDLCDYACGFDRESPLSTISKTVFRHVKEAYDKIGELWHPFVSWEKAADYRIHLLEDMIKVGQVSVPFSVAIELYFILQQKDTLEYLNKSGYRFLDINGLPIDAREQFGLLSAESVSAFVNSLSAHFSIHDNRFIEMIVSIYNHLQKDMTEVMEKLWGYSKFDKLWNRQRKDISFYPYLANKVVIEPDFFYQGWYKQLSPLISTHRTDKLVIHLNGIFETTYYFTAIASMFAYAYLALSDFKKLYLYKDFENSTSVRETIKVTLGEEFLKKLDDTLQHLL
ncbi:MAG: hypothetical protein ACOX6O_10995 [Christensenellales bacterium]